MGARACQTNCGRFWFQFALELGEKVMADKTWEDYLGYASLILTTIKGFLMLPQFLRDPAKKCEELIDRILANGEIVEAAEAGSPEAEEAIAAIMVDGAELEVIAAPIEAL